MTLAVLGVAAGLGGVMLPSTGISWPTFGPDATETALTGGVSRPAAPSRTPGAAPTAARETGAARRIYRHSVIPGGVADKVELANILRTDLVVAAHYAGFDVGNARAVTVTAPRAVYVSYRKGDQIFWTAKKVMLEQGETLLTDGEHDIRARCANRISDVPQYPVEKHGPSEAELDTVLAGAGAGVDEAGGMLAVAADTADLGFDEAVGQRYFTTSFPNGAGLLMLADASSAQSRQPGQAPGMPDWYNARTGYGGVLGAGSRSGGSDGSAPADGDGDTGTLTPGSTVVPPAAGSPASEGGGETGGAGGAGGNTGTTPVAAPDGSGGSGSTGGNGSTGGSGSTGGTGSGGNTGGNAGDNTGGGATGLPVSTTPSLPTPSPDAGGDTPVITPGAPATPVTPGDTIVDPAAPAEVPEPGTLWLGGLAMAAMLWLRRNGARAG